MLVRVYKRVFNRTCKNVIFEKNNRCKHGLDLDLVDDPCSFIDLFTIYSKLKLHLNNEGAYL